MGSSVSEWPVVQNRRSHNVASELSVHDFNYYSSHEDSWTSARYKDAPALPLDVHILDQMDQPGGAAKVGQLLEETRKHDPKAILFSEANVNFVVYDHIQSGDTKGAIEILKLD